jgi:hypothetical protein
LQWVCGGARRREQLLGCGQIQEGRTGFVDPVYWDLEKRINK